MTEWIQETVRRLGRAQGSMMLEYVIVQLLFGVVLLGWMYANVYDFSTGLARGEATLGAHLVGFYQRILGGVSLPVP